MTQVMYIGPSLANASTAAGANFGGVTAIQSPMSTSGQSFLLRKQAAGSQFVVTPLTIADAGLIPYDTATSASLTRTKSRTNSAVLQSKFLQDLVVFIYGVRKDHVESYRAPNPKSGANGNLLVGPSDFALSPTPTTTENSTTTKSLVLHTPAGIVKRLPWVSQLSLRYNKSDNFTPGATRYDSNLAVLTPSTGQTKDVGFTLGLLNNAIILNATWYNTAQKNVTSGGGALLTKTLIDAWVGVVNNTALGYNTPANLAKLTPPPAALLQAYGYTVQNGVASDINRSDIVLTQDYVAKGAEFELIGNITPRWRVSLNAARQQAVTTNTGAAFRDLLYGQKINGQSLADNWIGAPGQSNQFNSSPYSFAQRVNDTVINIYENTALLDGGPNSELRKWRFNAVTNYDFARDGLLSGFSLGSGVRWQDKVAIGFPYINGPAGTPIGDVAHPFYGKTQTNVDAWIRYHSKIFKGKIGLTVQLNV
ncbi:MAG: hypothetical protein WCI73_21140, partial [Phycisphaerae bacterium]